MPCYHLYNTTKLDSLKFSQRILNTTCSGATVSQLRKSGGSWVGNQRAHAIITQ